MRQAAWVTLSALALCGVVEPGWAENDSLRFQAPLAPLLTGCDANPSDTPLDATQQTVRDFCRLVQNAHVQINKAKRAEMVSGDVQPQLLVQALRELLRDENYALIFTTECGAQGMSTPRAIVEVRIFSHSGRKTPVRRQAAADSVETTAERLERTAIEAEHPENRIEALASLTELGDANAEAALLSFRLLHNDNAAAVREAAMEVLFDLRGQDVYDVISKTAIEDPSPQLRIKALENLVDLSSGSMSNALEAALLQALEDQDMRVSEHAKQLLATLQ